MSEPSSSPKGRTVSATYAARNFASLVNRVREERAAYVVERSGKPVAEIRSVEDRVVHRTRVRRALPRRSSPACRRGIPAGSGGGDRLPQPGRDSGESVGLLIDSSVLLAVERGQLRADDVAAAARPDEPVAIAAITASELLHGVQRLAGARRVRTERIITRMARGASAHSLRHRGGEGPRHPGGPAQAPWAAGRKPRPDDRGDSGASGLPGGHARPPQLRAHRRTGGRVLVNRSTSAAFRAAFRRLLASSYAAQFWQDDIPRKTDPADEGLHDREYATLEKAARHRRKEALPRVSRPRDRASRDSDVPKPRQCDRRAGGERLGRRRDIRGD